jgi:hypothetical protein
MSGQNGDPTLAIDPPVDGLRLTAGIDLSVGGISDEIDPPFSVQVNLRAA